MKRIYLLPFLFLLMSACGSKTPTADLMDVFLRELNENPERAYEMTSQDFKAETTLEELVQFRDAFPEIQNFDHIKSAEAKEDQGFITLTGTLVTKDREEKVFESLWIQKKGDWWLVHLELK